MKQHIFILAFFTLKLQVFSQVTFEKTYGGELYDAGFSVKQTADQGYIAVGTTYSFDTGPKILLIRTDPYGDTVWTGTFPGTGKDIIVDNDGGFVLCGGTYTTSEDVVLLKTDINGELDWIRTFGGNDSDYGYSLQKTSDGGFIICGSTKSYGAQLLNIYVVKTDSNGIFQWENSFSGLALNEGRKVRQNNDGDYIVSGLTSMLTDRRGYWGESFLLKIDVTGDSVWMKTYPGYGAYSFAITSDNGYLLCSTVGNFAPGGQDIDLIRTNSFGDTLWTKTLSLLNPFNEGLWIEKLLNDNYIICGSSATNSDANKFNALLIKVNSSGDTLWTQYYGGIPDDAVYCVEQTQDEGYIMCGFTESMGYGWRDLYLIKTDDQGVVTSIRSQKNDLAIHVYPNPVSDFLQVDIQNSRVEYQLSLCDMHGNQRILSTLPAGRQQISLDVSDLPSGVYLLEVKQNNLCVGAKKVIVH